MKLILKGNETSPEGQAASPGNAAMPTEPAPADVLASVFEERAENLSKSELETWTTYTPTDSALIGKLMSPGAKLLIGPRGSGKSTLLRTAYFRLLHDGDALAVYVNYARSLALEPLFHRRANALQVFRQWLLMKIVLGVETSLRDMQQSLQGDFSRLSAVANTLVRQLETGLSPETIDDALAPSHLTQLLGINSATAHHSFHGVARQKLGRALAYSSARTDWRSIKANWLDSEYPTGCMWSPWTS